MRPSRALLIVAHVLPYAFALAAVLSLVLQERRR